MTFSGSTELSSLNELVINGTAPKAYVRDPNVPDLLATNAATDEIINGRPYKSGNIILQDKASCFPAHLLLNAKPIFQRDGRKSIGDVLDACAAPGNKTSHAASILITKPNDGTRKPAAQSVVFACERDSKRSETLQTMLDRAGASKMVKVLGKQDFLALDPHEARFSNVTHLLLDPSCSGSGILGREDIPSLVLPKDPRRKRANPVKNTLEKGTKKRKTTIKPQAVADMVDSEILASLSPPTVEINRVRKLSNLQTRMIEHAFAFPSAQVVTYSTCSIHVFENEIVALRALGSESAKSRGWRLLRRYEQPDGLKVWHHRGDDLDWYEYEKPVEEFWGAMTIEEKSEFREACIRCQRGGPDGTMGFFVVGFVRDPSTVEDPTPTAQVGEVVMKDDQDEDEVWEGFSAGEEA